jgi:hypothetical protein
MLYLIEKVEAFTGDLTIGIDDHRADQGAGTNLSGALRR